jgi:hypothetical protein
VDHAASRTTRHRFHLSQVLTHENGGRWMAKLRKSEEVTAAHRDGKVSLVS